MNIIVPKFISAGDFYPLMPQSDSFYDWSAYQFHRPDLNSGIIETFRKKDSPIEKICFEFRGLDPSATYQIENADTQQMATLSGKDLMEKGWPVEIFQKTRLPSVLLSCSKTQKK